MASLAARGAQVLAGAAAIVVLLAVGMVPFATPVWMYPTQDRAGAEAWTGWPADQVHAVSGSALAEVLVGPPDFAQVVDGQPVFDAAEASHLRDVHRLALEFYAAVAIAALALTSTRLALGSGRFWRAIRVAAVALAAGVVVLGIVATVAFDQAFDVAHRLFFAAGTYSFDPSTSRMVQLFPEAFWEQTGLALGVVLVALALATRWFAGTRLAASATVRIGPVAGAPPDDATTAPRRAP